MPRTQAIGPRHADAAAATTSGKARRRPAVPPNRLPVAQHARRRAVGAPDGVADDGNTLAALAVHVPPIDVPPVA